MRNVLITLRNSGYNHTYHGRNVRMQYHQLPPVISDRNIDVERFSC